MFIKILFSSISVQLKTYFGWCYRKSRDRKRYYPEPEVKEVCSAHAQPFPAFFSYYSSTKCSTVVPVQGLPEVTPSGFPWVCACTTGSCAIFA